MRKGQVVTVTVTASATRLTLALNRQTIHRTQQDKQRSSEIDQQQLARVGPELRSDAVQAHDGGDQQREEDGEEECLQGQQRV